MFALPPWASPSIVEAAAKPIMGLFTLPSTSASHLLWVNHTLRGGKFFGSLYDVQKQNIFPDSESVVRASARRRKSISVKKLSNDEQSHERAALRIHESSSDQRKVLVDGSSVEDDYLRVHEGSAKDSVDVPSRKTVLQACIFTSALIGLLGVTIRQVSHVASVEGLPIHDCSTEVQFGFEMWHLELITGLVVLISSSRYLLLRIWPDFAESTEAANQQVLRSLQPLDYIVVAFLPGISEELLFRGALLPLFGINTVSILVVAAIFGALHLGSGRKYSFAVWATFVGFVYGYAAFLSSSIVVPMASHALNNLVGGILWRYSLKSNQVDIK